MKFFHRFKSKPRKSTIIIFMAMFSASLLSSFAFFKISDNSSDDSTTPFVLALEADTNISSIPTPTPVELDKESLNILLLGHGDEGHQGGYLTDAMLIAHFNTATNQFALISLPRDLWTMFPDGKFHKINGAYVQDTKEATVAKQVVSAVTGLEIDYFVEVNFFGLTAIVDELGGIQIDLPESFEDPWYPIRGREQDPCDFSAEEIDQLTQTLSGFQLEQQFECRYEKLSFSQGDNYIDGAQALKIARSRHSSSGGNDFSRSQRQQAILIGIKNKLLSTTNPNQISSVFDQLLHTFSSDIDLDIIESLSDLLLDFNKYSLTQIYLSTDNVLETSKGPSGQFILVPKTGARDYSSVHDYIKQQLENSD